MNQTAQSTPTAQRTPAPQVPMVTRNGAVIPALTLESVSNIIKGMQHFDRKDAGQLYKNLKVTGNGNEMKAYVNDNGKVVPASFIYNVNAVSKIAMQTPAATEAFAKAVAAEKAGDQETAHDAFREFLNKATVSFNSRSQQFVNGQLVQGILTLITTERGSLLKLENVSAMQAVTAPKEIGFNLADFMGTVLGSAAPQGSAETVAPASNAVASAFATQGS